MANIHIRQRHNLEHDDARARVEEIAKKIKDQIKANYAWKGDAMHFQRSGASGIIQVSEDTIEIKIKLGMLLAPMKGKIEDSIRQQINAALGTSKATKLT